MKTIFFAIVLVALSGAYLKGADANPLVACPSEVSKGCPHPQGLFPVYFAHPEHCSMFCECGMEGIAWAVSCSNGLYWNDNLNTCDWPSNVDCDKRPQP